MHYVVDDSELVSHYSGLIAEPSAVTTGAETRASTRRYSTRFDQTVKGNIIAFQF